MASKLMLEIIERIKLLERKFTDHLIDSGSIQTQLKVNTWLTGVIFVALIAKFVAEWFKG